MGCQVEQGAAEVTVEDMRRIWRADRSVQDTAPAFTFSGSSGSASIVHDMGSKNLPS